MYIWPKLHFPESLFSRIFLNKIYVWSKTHFPENLFFRNNISSKIQFLEAIFHWKNYCIFRLFISSKQNKLLVEIKKRCDNI